MGVHGRSSAAAEQTLIEGLCSISLDHTTYLFFPTTLGEIINTYHVGRRLVTSPIDVDINELSRAHSLTYIYMYIYIHTYIYKEET